MAYTLQQVVDRGRIPLNDSAKVRYSDATLLLWAIDAITFAATKRPDLLLGASWAPDYSVLTLGSTFPFSARYVAAVADYVTARAELVDDESVDEGRFAALIAMFESKLVSP